MPEDKIDPSNPSSDHAKIVDFLNMVDSIMGGTKTMREAGEAYLPKFEAEDKQSYDRRLEHSKFTNIFSDIVDSLCKRPFREQVKISDETDNIFKEYSADVDGKGNSLHSFAYQLYKSALTDDVTWIFVDYTPGIPEGISLAEEKELGARPLWRHYESSDVIAVYSDVVNGQERFTEVRLRESEVIRRNFKEKIVEKIRVFRHEEWMEYPTWEVWRKVEKKANQQTYSEWVLDIPPTEMMVDCIPIIPVIFGTREGCSWRIKPPLRDAAYLQVELYQQENALKNIKTYTAFPMLSASGVQPEPDGGGGTKDVVVGPNTILYAPPGEVGQTPGKWSFIEPNGNSLEFLLKDIKETIKELRELGRQPLTVQSENLTVVTTAVAADKRNSAIQTWARLLEMALVNAFYITAKWLNIEEPTVGVTIYNDFDLGFGDDDTFKYLIELAIGEYPMISREALLEEAKRRGLVSPSYNIQADLDRLMEDMDHGKEVDETIVEEII